MSDHGDSLKPSQGSREDPLRRADADATEQLTDAQRAHKPQIKDIIQFHKQFERPVRPETPQAHPEHIALPDGQMDTELSPQSQGVGDKPPWDSRDGFVIVPEKPDGTGFLPELERPDGPMGTKLFPQSQEVGDKPPWDRRGGFVVASGEPDDSGFLKLPQELEIPGYLQASLQKFDEQRMIDPTGQSKRGKTTTHKEAGHPSDTDAPDAPDDPYRYNPDE